jgi:hypothetical protein
MTISDHELPHQPISLLMLYTKLRPLVPTLRLAHTIRSAHKMSMSLDYTQDRATELKENMETILSEIESVSSGSKARLVPISKIKPASDIKALYDAGYRHFGENYIQELADKAEVVSQVPFVKQISDQPSYLETSSGISWETCRATSQRSQLVSSLI